MAGHHKIRGLSSPIQNWLFWRNNQLQNFAGLEKSLKSKKLKGIVLIQDYFKAKQLGPTLDDVKLCAEREGFSVFDSRLFLENIRSVKPAHFRSLWIPTEGGHLSAQGNKEKAMLLMQTIKSVKVD